MLAVFLLLGPLEVLVPFLVRDRLGGDASTFGYLLACYGGASAVASLVVASLPLPRRYLSWMIVLWGFGTLPFGLVATTDSFWVMALCLAFVGAGDGAGMVLWGTLLQRGQDAVQQYADLIYNGLWFTAHHQDLAAYVQSTQRYVTGEVRLLLHPVGEDLFQRLALRKARFDPFVLDEAQGARHRGAFRMQVQPA